MIVESAVVPISVAYGGGGLFGIAYCLGVAEALVDGGVPLGAAPSIGTSAGSWAAASMGLSIRWATSLEVLGDNIPRLPDPRAGRLHEVASLVYGDARAPTMRAVMCQLPRLQRVVMSGADHRAADLVAASSAVPGLLAPHRIGGKRYVDGGVRSMASADLATPATSLLVIAPLAGPMFGPGGGVMERNLRRDMRRWRTANSGSTIWLIRPNHAIAGLSRRPDQLFDADRAIACYDLAYEQGRGILERWTAAYGASGISEPPSLPATR